MKIPAAIAVAFLALTLAACGSSSSSSTPASTASTTATTASTASSSSSSTAASSTTTTPATTPSAGSTVKVTMKSLAFSPAVVHAKVGQTVMWTNNDSPPHNVTYVSGPKFTSSSTMDPGAKFQIKLTQPGTIHYFCSIHPFMKATIVVSK